MKKNISKLYSNQEGQGLVEYSLIFTLVILGAMGAVSALGGGVSELYETIKTNIVTLLS